RTKSIYSIWNKMQKQHNDVEHIYDLFAIRIIIDTPERREKPDCWLAYSVVTDMYQPNPARLKDWLSIPKSNGYESLHITVKGPDNKWVEVQIRTRRMDEIAEKGIAAHWKYKGIKSENGLDTWMNHVREILETADSGPTELMKNMSLDMYSKEVFVFTPRGDLFRLPLGATVLDFAFYIHSHLGCTCTGAKVNGRTRKLNSKLRSGDTVEIMTSAQQQPKLDWLSFVVTTKARNKIRQSVNERANRVADLGREMLQRRLKNRKSEIDDGTLTRIIKKLGYKTATDFYVAIGDEQIGPDRVIAEYEALKVAAEEEEVIRSANTFTLQTPADEQAAGNVDILVIGDNIKGVNYRLARCCNPIYGDSVFGFISSEG
ncbi:MAG: TGS domain-containing protein, partial [Paramuribaculum sp.]|nr:TGS domain-containing protein [Paramuribaculum sp.]